MLERPEKREKKGRVRSEQVSEVLFDGADQRQSVTPKKKKKFCALEELEREVEAKEDRGVAASPGDVATEVTRFLSPETLMAGISDQILDHEKVVPGLGRVSGFLKEADRQL